MQRPLTSIALGLTLLMGSALADAQISVSVTFAPPPLPVYVQPEIPADGYIWTPGYWAWDGYDYYWVPGTWVEPPTVGVLWTPGYWGWGNGGFLFHVGYWGQSIGYYGGVNYGYGYGGRGYSGGRWNHDRFEYNRAVNHIDVHVVNNYYNERVVNHTPDNHVSYSGGRGGIQGQPDQREMQADRLPHNVQTPLQVQHEASARSNQQLHLGSNHGAPPIAATQRANQFNAPGVVQAQPRQGAEKAAERAPNFQARPNTAQPERNQQEQNQHPQQRQAEPPKQEQRQNQPAPQQQARPERPAPQQHQAEQQRNQREAPEHREEKNN